MSEYTEEELLCVDFVCGVEWDGWLGVRGGVVL